MLVCHLSVKAESPDEHHININSDGNKTQGACVTKQDTKHCSTTVPQSQYIRIEL